MIAAIFEQFPVRGSVRGVWLWLRDRGLKLPLNKHGYVSASTEIVWVDPTYHAVHTILTHPAYAGTYTFGRTGQVKQVGDDGVLRVRRRVLPRTEWQVCITDHHEGFIDWNTYLDNQTRIGANIRPTVHQPGTGAVRRAAPCCKDWPPAGSAGASSPSTTTANTKPPRATTAPAPASSSTAAAPGICVSVASRSTPRSPPCS